MLRRAVVRRVTEIFTVLVSRNPSIGASVQHGIFLSTYFKALKLRNVPSGLLKEMMTCILMIRTVMEKGTTEKRAQI